MHEASRLRDLLDSFIDKYVLCGSCKNPETELILTKDEFIYRDCKACGKRSDIDMRHRLSTFILKNPPKSKKMKGKKGGVAGADSIPKKDAVGEKEDDSDDELTKKIEAGAAEVLTPEQAAALIAKNADDDDWAVDTSKEAVAARANALDSKLQATLVLDDDDDDAGGPYDAFGEWVRENDATDTEIFKKAETDGLAKKHKLLVVLVQAIFTEKIVAEIPAHLPLFQKVPFPFCLSIQSLTLESKLTTSEKHQKSLLGGIERFVGETHPQLIKADLAKILMAFYQADILEEEVVKNWGTHTSKKVH